MMTEQCFVGSFPLFNGKGGESIDQLCNFYLVISK